MNHFDESTSFILMTSSIAIITLFVSYKYIQYSKNNNRVDQMSSFFAPTTLLANQSSKENKNAVQTSVSEYSNLFKGARTNVGSISSTESINLRKKEYESMVSKFYDLVTDFYEYGWGQSFHFAPRYLNEGFTASIARAEHFIAMKLKLKSTDHVLDIGCGIGGPMRCISRFADVAITGITINEYQVNVGNRYNREGGFDKCVSKQGDFMKLPFEDNTFHAVYALEATCHAPDKTACFKEALRVLKPGGYFAAYEWMMVGNYNAENPLHTKLKEGIEVGNGLPTLETPEMLISALKGAGFEIVEHFDVNANGDSSPYELPWYHTLLGSFSLSGFRMSKAGQYCTHFFVTVLEAFKIAPKGSVQVHEMLIATADDLVMSGQLGIMTPSYYFLARKPTAAAFA